MLINLNGWPGAGKLTVGRILAEKLGGRLLDNHSILNLASAVTRVGVPQYYETARAIRAIAFDRILELPSQFPFVLTNVVARGGTSGFLEDHH
jgi:shikimate kinase